MQCLLQANRKIIVLTGSELRHTFFRKWIALSDGISVLQSYCEGTEKSIGAIVEAQENNDLRMRHLRAREQSEEDFFRLYVDATPDRSNPIFLPKGEINSPANTQQIIDAAPDLLIAYGCSIIREPLLAAFPHRLVNIHLGLSPYYRGSGTNYWPLVNSEPEYVGATFMYMDAGVDTGEIIHQVRASVAPGDTPSQIGNRLIVDMAKVCAQLITRFDQIAPMPQPPTNASDRYYRKKDYTEESVAKVYENFANGMVEKYIAEQSARHARSPLVLNPALSS
jgi:phosphoribosylglycinamide formyltransferase 1